MSFDASVVTRVYPPSATPAGLKLRWEATSPPGTVFQVYASGDLVWAGADTKCVVPIPSAQRSPPHVGRAHGAVTFERLTSERAFRKGATRW